MTQPKLLLIDMAEDRKWDFRMVTPPMVIGRNSSCDVALAEEASMSGEHAKLTLDHQDFVCTDLGSTNGTRVNNMRIDREILHDGDILSLGKRSFLIKTDTDFPRLYCHKEGRMVAIGMLPFMMGRTAANTFMIPDSSVSTRHASIVQEKQSYYIKDLKSTNGTRVNQRRIETAKLEDHAHIQLGKWVATFLLENMEPDSYELRILSGDQAGTVVPIAERSRIGRTPENDVVIPHTTVSQNHAVVLWSKGNFWLQDLQSSNGTRVNGMKIDKVPLKHGDEIVAGDVSLLFYNKNMSSEKFYLVLVGGAQGGQEITLKDQMAIGRAAASGIQVAGKEVSFYHAQLLAQKGSFLIKDLQSMNGTLVNDRKVESALLKHGDEVTIGNQRMVFRSSIQPRPQLLLQESFVLIPVYGNGYGRPIAVEENLSLGSQSSNKVMLKDHSISATHAVIFREKNQYCIRDSSQQGTFINNERVVDNEPLEHGDELRLGRYNFIFKNSLRPLPRKDDLTLSYWLSGMAAAAILMIVALLFIFPFTKSNHNTVAEDEVKIDQRGPQQNDREVMAAYRKQATALQHNYLYAEALQLNQECQKQLTLVAHRQSLEEESKKIGVYADLFAEFVRRLQTTTRVITVNVPDRGACIVEKVTAGALYLRPAEAAIAVFEMPWKDTAAEVVFQLLDETGLPSERLYDAIAFALAHEEIGAAERYLTLAFEKYPGEREKIERMYADLFKIPVPLGGFVLYNGKLISMTQKQALDREEAERQEQLKTKAAFEQQKKAEEIARQRERDEFPLRCNIIEDFVRTYSYQKAIEQFKALDAQLYADDLKQKVQRRIVEIGPMAYLFGRLVEAINTGKLKSKEVVFGENIRGQLVMADQEYFQVSIPQGSIKVKWYTLPPQKLFGFYEKVGFSAEELFFVGDFCFTHNLFDEGNRCLVQFLDKAPQHKARVDKYLSVRLDIPIPEGGFVPYQGQLVSKDEREKRLKGLVRYKGQWVTTDDKEKLASGLIKHEGKWITPDEKKFLGLGYVRYQDKWYSKEELASLRTNWDNAWTHETPHYKLRSNISEAFIQELGRFVEATFDEYAKFFGKTVNTKMTIYAMRTYEDYRQYCISTGNSVHLRAGGFATSAANIGVGWLRDNQPKYILQVMVHEGAHLYHFNAFPNVPLPSWFAEGVATQFEGYQWDGKNLKVDYIAVERLRWLQRAMLRNQYIPLAQLLDGNAIDLINNNAEGAANFYAECWGFQYFMKQVAASQYQQRFQKYSQDMNLGKLRGNEKIAFMAEFEKDLKEIESLWRKHILAMD